MAAAVSPVSMPYLGSGIVSSRIPLHTSSRNTQHRPFQASTSLENSVWKSSVADPSTNDSSDDEDLAPIKLSAEAQAILGEDNSKADAEQENILPNSYENYKTHNSVVRASDKNRFGSGVSPVAEDGSPAPRTSRAGVRPSPPRTLARDGSFMYKTHEKHTTKVGNSQSVTPAPTLRRIRVSGSRYETRSPPSSQNQSQFSGSKEGSVSRKSPTTASENHQDNEHDHGVVYPSTIVRSRKSEEPGIHSTTRVRRIGTGTLLNGPVRRGMIKRQSEEDDEADKQDSDKRNITPEVEQSRRAREPDLEDVPDQLPFHDGSPKHQKRDFLSRTEKPVSTEVQHPSDNIDLMDFDYFPAPKHSLSTSASGTKAAQSSATSQTSPKSTSSNRKPIFKIPSLPPLDSVYDQENEPPPTFKRTKASAPLLDVHEDQRPTPPELKSDLASKSQSAAYQSPSRQPLAARSNNTPHRPAPAPPPKLSLIDVATSAGASSRSKKSVHYVLNGRTYRRLDMIGRGGSSRVFRIMAENYKIFAMKRVNLEEADEAAIVGYKGEIDLLKKLENVDRVVRLFDYEVNEEKGVLSVLMEMGESDFSKMLNEQLKGEAARLDITFTRHYWKEMLECVKAVHEHGIVHSDLKPANFLLVKGQLKLIDFGIAGAIQDNTVNVHRENQIGTPNYMSPESLVFHTPTTDQATRTKLLKVGKPSDVWSLGCILYQMTYGQPPFAHIAKQFERIMSIPNPKVEIQFPSTGVGGAVVPFGLIKTLRRCLQRDQTLRPTIEELLSDSDPFLHPVAISPDMLGRVIGNVIGYCRKREEKLREEGKLQVQDGISILPKDDEMRGWPGAFYAKLREAGIEGTAW